MFDQIVGEKTARKPFALAVSVSGQAAVLGLAIMVPLLHTEAITTGRLMQFVPLKPWGGVTHTQKVAPGRVPGKTAIHPFSASTLTQPAHIPQTVTMIDDGPAVDAIPGSTAFTGVSDGVFGVLPPETPLPPKPAPPQTVTTMAPTSTVPTRLRIGGMVQAAKLMRQVKPIYPVIAKQGHLSGDVLLEAVISREGTIESLRVVNGSPLFVNAALDAVKQWLYQPTLLNGDPVEVLTQIEVHFRLGG